jgi:hypothetical protein
MALPARSPLPGLLKVGRGRMFFASLAGGVVAPGFADYGNCQSVAFEVKDERDHMKEMMDPYGLDYDIALTGRKAELTVKGTEYPQENLQLLMMGTETPYTQSSESVTGEDLTTSLVLGSFYKTKYSNISAVSLTISSTTLILGAPGVGDYQIIDTLTGVIQINQVVSSTNAAVVVAGVTVVAAYTAAATTSTTPQGQVNLATQAIIETQCMFLPNNARGINQLLYVWRVSWYPNQALEFLGDKYGTWTLKGDVLSDQVGQYGGSPTNPWGYIRNTVAG